MQTSRLEAFSDGVFAIAATLLILDVTADARGGALGATLEHSWPQFAAYAVAFVTIAIWWVNHHIFMSMIGQVDRRFLFINIGVLASIAFLPYPTHLVAEHLRDNGLRAAAIAYGVTMTAGAVSFVALWLYASADRRLIGADVEQHAIDHMTRSIAPGAPVNATATALAVWSPVTAIVLFTALSGFYIVGSSYAKGPLRAPSASSS